MKRRRSPYAAIPDPRWPVRVDRADLAVVEDVTPDPNVLWWRLREILRTRVTGRASHPEEVRLLREWVEVKTVDSFRYWWPRLTGVAPEPNPETSIDVDHVECARCGSEFTRAARRGRPRTRCYSCSPERVSTS